MQLGIEHLMSSLKNPKTLNFYFAILNCSLQNTLVGKQNSYFIRFFAFSRDKEKTKNLEQDIFDTSS